MSRILWISIGVLAMPLLDCGRASGAMDSKESLETQLRTAYVWTNFDGRTGQVLDPGTILVVRKEGISTNPVNAPFNAPNNYKDGQVRRSAMSLFMQDAATTGRFRAGDRVFVTKTEVKDNSVVLSLLSLDGISKASVSFQFAKGYLTSVGFDPIAAVIDELLRVEEARTPEPPYTSPAAPEAVRPIEQPAVSPGQTIEEVLAALGPPEIVADLGRKQVYLFRDAKVTFLDGKVTDVK